MTRNLLLLEKFDGSMENAKAQICNFCTYLSAQSGHFLMCVCVLINEPKAWKQKTAKNDYVIPLDSLVVGLIKETEEDNETLSW